MRPSTDLGFAYEFRNPGLLDTALVHRSYTAEHQEVSDNERMEFLGDAVLQLVITDHLYENYPELREGELAKSRAACVNQSELALIAKRIGLGRHVLVGAGEEATGGRDKPSILADTMEAVIAAVYLDGGLEAAREVILDLWGDRIRLKAENPGRRDYKTRYQEVLATDGKRPVYEIEGEGPDHDRSFVATVSVDGIVTGRGEGRSKKEAEQQAARSALER